MITVVTPRQYNETISKETGIVIREDGTRELLAQALSLLQQVVDDDSGRYNRPSYYYKVASFLKEKL